jgi:hypothetical protein
MRVDRETRLPSLMRNSLRSRHWRQVDRFGSRFQVRGRRQAVPIHCPAEGSDSKCETSVARPASGGAVHVERFACDEMHRNGIGAECIEHDYVELRVRARQRQACIAQHHATRRATSAQEPEISIVSRDSFNGWIDLIEGPSMEFCPLRRQGSDAQAHRSNVGRVA